MADGMIKISNGMPHLEDHRKKRIDAFSQFVAVLPWFNINLLHKLYINIFYDTYKEDEKVLKENSSFELRSITCADLLNSPSVKRIDYNVFIIEENSREELRNIVRQKPKLLLKIGEFMLSYAEECRQHFLGVRYREVQKIEGNLIINPLSAANKISGHIAKQLNQSGDNTSKEKTVEYYLNILDQDETKAGYAEMIKFLEGTKEWVSGNTEQALEKYKDLKVQEELETDEVPNTVTVKLPKEVQKQIISNFEQRIFDKIFEKAVHTICFVDGYELDGRSGSGILLKGGYLLTTNHLIPNIEIAEKVKIRFRYSDGNPNLGTIVSESRLDPATLFYTNNEDELDYTLVKIEVKPWVEDEERLTLAFGINVSRERNKGLSIQYSRSGEIMKGKTGVLHVRLEDDFLYHNIDMTMGASGSPVLNEKGNIIAMNRAFGKSEVDNNMQAVWVEKIREDLMSKGINLDQLSVKELEGYTPTFLGEDQMVNLPQVAENMLENIAEVQDNEENVLIYPHHNIKLNKKRRLAYYSAAMKDGRQYKKIPRENDRFVFDKRVDKEFQCGDILYKGNSNIDRGHLTGRSSVMWGQNIEFADIASGSVNTYSNIAPMSKLFNRKIWSRLENGLNHVVQKNGIRAIEITGPVFSEYDVEIDGVQIPLLYWKVFYYLNQERELCRISFLAAQPEILDEELVKSVLNRDHPYYLLNLEAEMVYQVYTGIIENLTGLSFTSAREIADDPLFADLKFKNYGAQEEELDDGPFKILMVYSSQDEKSIDLLKSHLTSIKRRYSISLWAHIAGNKWNPTFNKEMEEADMILFLLSSVFLASDFISVFALNREIDKQIEKGTTLIPIILSPCLWKNSIFRELQVLPKDARPISEWENEDEAFVSVVQGITDVVKIDQTLDEKNQISQTDFYNKTIILKYIKNGNIEKAINRLAQITKNYDNRIYESSIMLASRIISLDKDLEVGFISTSEYEIYEDRLTNEVNQVIESISDWTNFLEYNLPNSNSPLILYQGSRFKGKPCYADIRFVPSLEKINAYAQQANVNLHVTSSFRATTNVNGVIEKPATYSNHLVGHSIDINIRYGDTEFANSKVLAQYPDVPPPVRQFLKSIIDDPTLRWGGLFETPDPVHIDDGLSMDRSKWEERYQVIQRAVQLGEEQTS